MTTKNDLHAEWGTLFGAFDTVMALNLENGAADHKLSSETAIDNSVIGEISDDDLKRPQ